MAQGPDGNPDDRVSTVKEALSAMGYGQVSYHSGRKLFYFDSVPKYKGTGRESNFPVRVVFTGEFVTVEICVVDLKKVANDSDRKKILELALMLNYRLPKVSYAICDDILVSIAWSQKYGLTAESFSEEFDRALFGASNFGSTVAEVLGDAVATEVQPPVNFDPAHPCRTCLGHGLWGMGDPSPMGPIDAADGYPTIPCPECGASSNPVKPGSGQNNG